jgi:tetratricopeptide (TPR) repeat protein
MSHNNSRCAYGLMLVFILALLASPAYSGKTEDLYKRAASLYAEGKYGAALEPAKEALAEAENEFDADSIQLSRPLDLLAAIHQEREEWREASGYLERLRSVQEAVLGPRHMKVAKTISTLIAVYEKQGGSLSAEKLNRMAAERWGKQENVDVKPVIPLHRASNDPALKGSPLENWKQLSASSNYIKVAMLMDDYHRKHKYLKEDFFVCSDMAIEVWDIIKTAGINAKLIVGNVERDIIKYESTHEYIAKMNHVWVLAEVIPATWVPVEPTAGKIMHPQVQNFELYQKGSLFDNPRRFKEFSESRNSLFETCKEARMVVEHYKNNYVGKPATSESSEHAGRAKQKIEDCKRLEQKVLSYLNH